MASNYNNWIQTWPNPYPGMADYIPKERTIASITNSYPAIVTTTVDHGYNQGNIVRILVPPTYGMVELNNQYALATVLTNNTFSMPIDTTHYSLFNVPVGATQTAQCIPIGELNETLVNATFNDR